MFKAATGLMLPKDKKDLGKHCFGYSSILVNEYYEGSSEDDAPDLLGLLQAPVMDWIDPLKSLRHQLSQDWSKAKNHEGHCDLDSFRNILRERHARKLGGITEATDAYTQFMERLFD